MKKGKKFLVLFLLFSLLDLSGELYAKRWGAELEIWGKGAKFIKGELIAVKKNTLLLIESGIDVTIDIKVMAERPVPTHIAQQEFLMAAEEREEYFWEALWLLFDDSGAESILSLIVWSCWLFVTLF